MGGVSSVDSVGLTHGSWWFARFLKIADGSNAETQALSLIAGDAGIFEIQQVKKFFSQTNEIGRMLNSLMRRHSG